MTVLPVVAIVLGLVALGGWRDRGPAGAFVSVVVFVPTAAVLAVALTRIIGGPGAADDCAGDECDANMVYLFPFFIVGLPVGLVAGWLAARTARRRLLSARA